MRLGAFPFLSTEAVRLARATDIGQVHWYSVFGGGRLAEELAMAWALDSTETADLDEVFIKINGELKYL